MFTDIIVAHRPATRRLIGRAGLVLTAFTTLLASAAVLQEVHRTSTHKRFAADQSLIDIGGRNIRLFCTGSGDLTFVLEAGATGFAETWTWVQDALDDGARVCSYDRAGLGLSDVSEDGFDPASVANDLHAALATAGEAGPYVLVGHSLGGFFIRDYAAQYPHEVTALVFVDTSHEDQLAQLDEEVSAQTEQFPTVLRTLATASTTGLLRVWNPIAAGAAGLEGDALAAAHAFAGDRVHLATSADEVAAWTDITDRLRQQSLPVDLPVLAVTAGAGVEGQPDFSVIAEPLHAELAARFDGGEHILIDDATHFSIVMDPHHAATLAALIADFVNRILE